MSRLPREFLWDRLQASQWLRHVDRGAWDSAVDRVEQVTLGAGEVLFRQGEPGDALYLVIEGRLRAFGVRDDGEEIPLAEIGEGKTVGEIQLLTGGERSASVAAVETTRLLKVPEAVFDELARASPAMLEQLLEVNRRRLDRSLLAEVIPGLFGPLEESGLRFLESEVEWIGLERGESLFERGDPGDSMSVLLRGRLAAVTTDAEGRERIVNEIARGECVGEMGLLTGSARSIGVRALRDSRLVSFSKKGFERVTAAYPQALVGVTRVLVDRLTRATGDRAAPKPANVRTLAVVPAHDGVALRDFIERLVAALSTHGETLWLSRRRLEDKLGLRAALGEAGGPAEERVSAWLDDQELKFRFVLYEADAEATPWTSRCLRQADQIVLVAAADGAPEVERLNHLLDLESRSEVKSRTSLVVLHADRERPPRGTGRWLEALGLERHHHVRLALRADFERLGRFFAGRAVGLALGGGGARAFAHIGVMRALEEAGIAIDMVGGTSVGAYMAALCAKGLRPDAMIQASRRAFLEGKPHRDLTLPLFGFLSGRRGDRIQQREFGDLEIEDLWTSYFAISANLTTARQVIHTRGTVCSALRASLAVPGAIVPAVSGHDLLVDGGVLNNLPSDVMRRFCGGRVIAVDVSPATELSVETADEGLPSPWRVLWSRFNPFMDRIRAPVLMEILARSATLASVQSERASRVLADLYLKPPVDRFGIYQMRAIDKIVDIGYHHAREKLAEWEAE